MLRSGCDSKEAATHRAPATKWTLSCAFFSGNNPISFIACSLQTNEPALTNLGVELVVAQVKRRVDGLERLEVEVHPLLLTLVGHDSPAVDHQTIRGHSGVEPAETSPMKYSHS